MPLPRRSPSPLASRAKTCLPWPLSAQVSYPSPSSLHTGCAWTPSVVAYRRGGVSSTGGTVLGLSQLLARCNDHSEADGPSAERRWGAMTMLEISQEVRDPEFGVTVLGQFRLLRGMNVVRIPRASQRLLAFLALHDRIVER